MSQPWFDPSSGALLFDEIVAERPSYQKILADGKVTPAEFQEQAQRVVGLLQQLEEKLPPEAKSIATEALCELAVLHALAARAARPAA